MLELEATKTAMKIDGSEIEPFKNLGLSDNEVRALFAIEIQIMLFDEDKRDKILDDLEITDVETREKISDRFDKFKDLIEKKIYLMHGKNIEENPEGVYNLNYRPRYSYFDDEEQLTLLDLGKLQDGEAKFKDINILKGQVVLKYNPTEEGKIKVYTEKFDIPESIDELNENGTTNALNQLLSQSNQQQQQQQNNKQPDYTKFRRILERCNHKDVVVVLQDGELIHAI